MIRRFTSMSHNRIKHSLEQIVILATIITGSMICMAQAPQTGGIGVTAGTGTLLIAGTNMPFVPRGFTSLGVLYPTMYEGLCTLANNSPTSPDGMDLIAAHNEMTGQTSTVLNAMINTWFFNTVRFHVSQGALEKEYRAVQNNPQALTPYTDMVQSIVSQSRARNLIVILVMQTEVYSCTAYRTSTNMPQKLPDQNTANAWKQLLNGSTIAGDRGVILEILNEPNTQIECGDTAPYNWDHWASGCPGVSQEGMITIGNILSRLAPNNVLLFDADNDAGGFQTFPSTLLPMMPPNSAYTVHPFAYVYDLNGVADVGTSETHWTSRFGDFQSQGNTVFITAWNESLNCPVDPNQTVTNDLVQQYLPARSIGLLGVGWDAPQSNSGYLVDSYGTSPTFAPQGQTSPANTTNPCNHTGAKLMQQQFQKESGK